MNGTTAKKTAFKELCRFPPEENKINYKCLEIKQVVARAMRKEAKQELNKLCFNFSSVFCFLRSIKKREKE